MHRISSFWKGGQRSWSCVDSYFPLHAAILNKRVFKCVVYGEVWVRCHTIQLALCMTNAAMSAKENHHYLCPGWYWGHWQTRSQHTTHDVTRNFQSELSRRGCGKLGQLNILHAPSLRQCLYGLPCVCRVQSCVAFESLLLYACTCWLCWRSQC